MDKTLDKALAKALLDRDEQGMFDIAAGARLNKLTTIELQDYMQRSRATRDKWSDVVKKQRRASQRTAGQRQTSENARSEQKSQLLQAVHQTFADRLAAVQADSSGSPTGTKATPMSRQKRQVVNRVERAVTRKKVAQAQETLVVEQRQARKTTTRDRAATKPAAPEPQAAAAKTRVAKSPADTLAAGKKPAGKIAGKTSAPAKPAVAPAKPAAGAKPTAAPAKPAAPAKAAAGAKPAAATKAIRGKKTVAASAAAKKTRTKSTNRLAGASGKPVMPAISSKAPVRLPASQGFSKAQIAANQTLHAKATKSRVAAGGTTKIKSHVADANRRQQSRRDSR